VFGSKVTILRDNDRRQIFRIVGEDEADPRGGSIAHVSACLSESESVRPWNWMIAKLKSSLSSRDRCRLAAES
jgi:hypothetical protein